MAALQNIHPSVFFSSRESFLARHPQLARVGISTPPSLQCACASTRLGLPRLTSHLNLPRHFTSFHVAASSVDAPAGDIAVDEVPLTESISGSQLLEPSISAPANVKSAKRGAFVGRGRGGRGGIAPNSGRGGGRSTSKVWKAPKEGEMKIWKAPMVGEVKVWKAPKEGEVKVEAGAAGAAGPTAAPTRDEQEKTTEVLKTKELRRKSDWRRAVSMLEHAGVHTGRVDAVNNGGLLVRFGALQAFLPLSQLDPARLGAEGGSKSAIDVARGLVGQSISAQVVEVDEEKSRLLVSEKQVLWTRQVAKLKEGQVLEGKVASITDFGVFVELQLAGGNSGIRGLVHLSELSWDPVQSAYGLVQPGADVSVKILTIDRQKQRLALSMKELQTDPLLETLDTLNFTSNSTEGSESDDALLTTPLPGLVAICRELREEEGVSEVTGGRQAVERRVVSQDLELWLSNAEAEMGRFTLLARAGRQVQEVHVTTTLDRSQMKLAVQRVTGRVL